jgi:hypothetical protein
MGQKRTNDPGFGYKEGVEIIAGPAGRKGKPACINIIGTFFKRGNLFSELTPGGDDA